MGCLLPPSLECNPFDLAFGVPELRPEPNGLNTWSTRLLVDNGSEESQTGALEQAAASMSAADTETQSDRLLQHELASSVPISDSTLTTLVAAWHEANASLTSEVGQSSSVSPTARSLCGLTLTRMGSASSSAVPTAVIYPSMWGPNLRVAIPGPTSHTDEEPVPCAPTDRTTFADMPWETNEVVSEEHSTPYVSSSSNLRSQIYGDGAQQQVIPRAQLTHLQRLNTSFDHPQLAHPHDVGRWALCEGQRKHAHRLPSHCLLDRHDYLTGRDLVVPHSAKNFHGCTFESCQLPPHGRSGMSCNTLHTATVFKDCKIEGHPGRGELTLRLQCEFYWSLVVGADVSTSAAQNGHLRYSDLHTVTAVDCMVEWCYVQNSSLRGGQPGCVSCRVEECAVRRSRMYQCEVWGGVLKECDIQRSHLEKVSILGGTLEYCILERCKLGRGVKIGTGVGLVECTYLECEHGVEVPVVVRGE